MKTLAAILSVVVVGSIVLACFTSSEVVSAVLFGWISFLVRVVPQIKVYWPSVAVGVTAIVLFGAGIHWLGRSWLRRRQTTLGVPVRWKVRWSAAVVLVVFLLFGAGIALVGIVHQMGWLFGSDRPLTGEGLKRHLGGNSLNNLRMLDLGMANYHAQYDRFPPGGTFSPDGEMGHSWETHLLPYLGYASNEIDMKSPWNSPRNEKYFKGVIPEFINPGFRTPDLNDARGFGLSHYSVNSRVLTANSSMHLGNMTDGASNTLLIGEVNARFQPWGHPLNWRDPAIGINRSPTGFGGTPGSGGAHFVMGDGSVRFVSDRISPGTLRAMSTPSGGEEIDPTGWEKLR
jgi:hypothetical protein